jgi:hypothetical protein
MRCAQANVATRLAPVVRVAEVSVKETVAAKAEIDAMAKAVAVVVADVVTINPVTILKHVLSIWLASLA